MLVQVLLPAFVSLREILLSPAVFVVSSLLSDWIVRHSSLSLTRFHLHRVLITPHLLSLSSSGNNNQSVIIMSKYYEASKTDCFEKNNNKGCDPSLDRMTVDSGIKKRYVLSYGNISPKKSFVLVKLTEQSLKAIEEYINCRDREKTGRTASISFPSNEGVSILLSWLLPRSHISLLLTCLEFETKNI